MNPMTNVKNINKLNEIELQRGTVNKKSWHDLYKDSAWIFIGGLSYGLTEGDVISVFSQYGEIVNINLIRDKKTGKTKGFCFLCYANQKSTVLAVDNLNGIKICGRTIRVDHVQNYKPPKDDETEDDVAKQLKLEGCAPKPIELKTNSVEKNKAKKVKKEKKKKSKKHKKKDSKKYSFQDVKVKQEKEDPGYSKHEHPEKYPSRNSQSDSKDSDSSSAESSDFESSQLSHGKKGRDGNAAAKRKESYPQSNRETHESNGNKRQRHDSSSDDNVKRSKPDSHQIRAESYRSSKSAHKNSEASSQKYSRSVGRDHEQGNEFFRKPSSSTEKSSNQARGRCDSSSSENEADTRQKSSGYERTYKEKESSYNKHNERSSKDTYRQSSRDHYLSGNREMDERKSHKENSKRDYSSEYRSDNRKHMYGGRRDR